jgi:homoserine kinase
VKGRGYQLDEIVANLGNIAGLVAALAAGDLELLGRSVDDRLVEPLRSRLIPGFDAVKKAALDAGGLGCSIAGSGPSMFAFAGSFAAAEAIGKAMQGAFRSAARLESDLFAGKVSRSGARLI